MTNRIAWLASSCLILGLAASAPAEIPVAWHTQSAFRMESVVVVSPGLDAKQVRIAAVTLPGMQLETLTPGPPAVPATHDLPAAPPADHRELKPTAVSENGLSVYLPNTKPREYDGIVVLWVGQNGDWSRPLIVNRTRAEWLYPSRVEPGGEIQVFGRDVGGPRTFFPSRPGRRKGYACRAAVALRNAQGQVWNCAVAEHDDSYVIAVELPEDLPEGDYEVWTHNTRGGAWNWSGPLALTVRAATPWPPSIIELPEELGNGLRDATEAIHRSLAELAAKGGGTLQIPAGVYKISDSFHIPPSVCIAGVGKGRTILVYDQNGRRLGGLRGKEALFNIRTRAGMRDLTIESNKLTEVGIWIYNTEGDYVSRDCFLERVEVNMVHGPRAEKTYAIFVNRPWNNQPHHAERLRMRSCEIAGGVGGMRYVNIRDSEFIDNRFQSAGSVIVHGSGMTHCVFTGNFAEPTKWSQRARQGFWWVTANGKWGGTVENYIAENHVRDMGPQARGPRNVGEGLALETINGLDCWFGKIGDSDAGSFVRPLDGPTRPGRFDGMFASIIAGPAKGQFRQVASSDEEGRITLTEPWAILPADGTEVLIGRAGVRNIIVRNQLERCGSMAVWGSNYDNRLELNDLRDVSGYFGVAGLRQGTDESDRKVGGIRPVFYTDFRKNFLTRVHGMGVYTWISPKLDKESGIVALGNTFRANQSRQSAGGIGVYRRGSEDRRKYDNPTVRVDLTVFDHNEIKDGGRPIQIDERTMTTVFNRNTFSEWSKPMIDTGRQTIGIPEEVRDPK